MSDILVAVSVLPDLDVLMRTHRSVAHSLIVYLPLTLAAIPLYWVNQSYAIVLLGAWLSLSSHVLLDSVGGYTPALWPILKEDLMASAGLRLKFDHSLLLQPSVRINRRPLTSSRFDHLDASVITGEGLLISALLVTASLLRLSAP